MQKRLLGLRAHYEIAFIVPENYMEEKSLFSSYNSYINVVSEFPVK